MKYEVLESIQDGETITTKVKYDFGGVEVEIDVPHFSPDSLSTIEQGIVNRGLSELRKIQSISKNEDLIKQIEIGKEKTIEVK